MLSLPLVLLILSLTYVTNCYNLTIEFEIEDNCEYSAEMTMRQVTFCVAKKENSFTPSYCCLAELPRNSAGAKFKLSKMLNLEKFYLQWHQGITCQIKVYDVVFLYGTGENIYNCSNPDPCKLGSCVASNEIHTSHSSLECRISTHANSMCATMTSTVMKCPLMTTITPYPTSSCMTSTKSTLAGTLTTQYLLSNIIMTPSPSIFQSTSTIHDAFVSSDIYLSSFPSTNLIPTPLESSQLICVSPSPICLHCPLDDSWPPTPAGRDATSTCHKGLFNATRHCNESGNWDPVICFANENFEAIASLASSSPYDALDSLSNSISTISAVQIVVLLDIIVSSNARNAATTEEFGQLLLKTFDEFLNETDPSHYDEEVSIKIF
uniref:G-protein coupled receptors family 2 profile 1 domain-containing protein n=1 Tax=Amphimedon queenslandica TaxID=400682 RepID=A0A1X7TE15_AMPQE